jgi:hypothetical protein
VRLLPCELWKTELILNTNFKVGKEKEETETVIKINDEKHASPGPSAEKIAPQFFGLQPKQEMLRRPSDDYQAGEFHPRVD